MPGRKVGVVRAEVGVDCAVMSKSADKSPIISKQDEIPAGYKWEREDQERSLKNAAQPAWRCVPDRDE